MGLRTARPHILLAAECGDEVLDQRHLAPSLRMLQNGTEHAFVSLERPQNSMTTWDNRGIPDLVLTQQQIPHRNMSAQERPLRRQIT